MDVVIRQNDGSLGVWIHAEARPAFLCGLVERVWLFDGVMAAPRERVFPDGTLEIITQIDGRYHDVEGVHLEPTPEVCVTGIRAAPAVIQAPPGRVCVLGIRLRPAGARTLLRLPLYELVDRTVDLRALPGLDAGALHEACSAAHTHAERLHAAVDWLRPRLMCAPQLDARVLWMAGCIERTRGAASIGALRERTGWSSTRMASAFREHVGVTPKRFARIHRFRHALDRLHRAAGSLATLALDAGYSDQPHMNAEFREFAGVTPGEYMAALRYPGSASLPEPA